MIVIKKDIEVRHFQKEFLISQRHVPMKHNMIWGYPPYYISLVLGQVSRVDNSSSSNFQFRCPCSLVSSNKGQICEFFFSTQFDLKSFPLQQHYFIQGRTSLPLAQVPLEKERDRDRAEDLLMKKNYAKELHMNNTLFKIK